MEKVGTEELKVTQRGRVGSPGIPREVIVPLPSRRKKGEHLAETLLEEEGKKINERREGKKIAVSLSSGGEGTNGNGCIQGRGGGRVLQKKKKKKKKKKVKVDSMVG